MDVIKKINDDVKEYADKIIESLKGKPLGIYDCNGVELCEGDTIIVYKKEYSRFEDGWGREIPHSRDQESSWYTKNKAILRLIYDLHSIKRGIFLCVYSWNGMANGWDDYYRPLSDYDKFEKVTK